MGGSKPAGGITARHERSQSARLDNFVDGAFAFAITLLVISGAAMPHSVDALIKALRGVPAFAACFLQLAWLWHGHVRWRESAARTDRVGLLLSLLLVFFALIFVFPLHLVYAAWFHSLTAGALSPDFVPIAGLAAAQHMRALFACYGLTYACMAGTLSVLHWHAARPSEGLRGQELVNVRMQSVMWACVGCVGLISMLLALLVPAIDLAATLAGFSYSLLALLGPVMSLGHRHYRLHPPT